MHVTTTSSTPPTLPRESSKLRVFVVDDHHVFREGLRMVLSSQPDMVVVGEAPNGTVALARFEEARPDLVILDISLPEMSGLEVAREITQRRPQTKVLMLTAHRADDFLRDALAAGALGFASKAQPVDSLVAAIRTVARGELFVARADATKVPERFGVASEAIDPLAELTKRERELFQLIVHGFTNEGLATRLSISVKTVETHRASINRKLRVHSTADLIRFAARHNLLATGETAAR